MSLVKVNEILQHASEHKYGVAAINTLNYETIKCAVAAAEAERVPVILQFFPGLDKYIPLKYIADMAVDMARKASVPVAVHLDHSATYEIAVSGMKAGFPSVMVDGSALSYSDNLSVTSAVVRTAAVFGIDVEAELGHVGSGARLEDITDSGKYTNVSQAKEFVEKTGCGSLAVAVGNAHGEYVQTPNLDFDRIAALHKAVPVPLVLHGCSDIPHEQLQESVRLGMSKFNIATEYFRACYGSIAKVIEDGQKGDMPGMMAEAAQSAIDFVRSKMRLLNPNGFSL